MKPYPTCPYCKTKKSATTIFVCKKEIRGCSQIFCRECCGGLTTVRCPNCQEAEFSGAVVAVGWVATEDRPE